MAPRVLPAGTVTFLFTDIEGSTRLLHELGSERYADALAAHRRVLRDAFARHGGVEVDTQGDAFFVAFPTAPGALAAASEAQEELELPVRMGLHTGTPLVTDEGYVGADVHRAARIAASGHGRQVLLSSAAAALVDGAAHGIRDLGEHRLKDLSAPERIFQLGERDFPPLKTLYRTNLPVPTTPFLGREHELAEVRELLARDGVRLLTLTGPGGSGKTRLSLQAAGDAADVFPDGVWWVPLAPVADAAGVVPAAERALGGGGSLAEIVGGRRLLLLLDNFEHVVEAAGDVAALLAACPAHGLLVSSRERLRVQGEQVYPVPTLARAEARQLFVARARAAGPAFAPDEHVDELCARLDDLPLALELAAARTSVLTPAQLLERLGSRLDLLRGGRDAERRQQTLRATIEWSYELLEPEEQRLLAALSVFRGGWTLQAAERVCDADVDLLESLVDKSLVRRWEAGRFGMLETIREFAAERLDGEERDRLRRRLLEHLLALFEDAHLGPRHAGEPQMELAREERPNIDVALGWAAEAREASLGLKLLERLELYWATNDALRGRERLDALVAAAEGDLPPLVHAHALRFRGATFDMSSRPDLAAQEYERALELARAAGDEDEAAHLAFRLASAAIAQGDVERGKRAATEALERGGVRGTSDEAIALALLARVAFLEGDHERGARLAREAAAAAEAVGFVWWRGVALMIAAEELFTAGKREAAEGFLRDGLEVLASVQDLVNLPVALALAAAVAAGRTEAERAGTLWGALEAEDERATRPTTSGSIEQYGPYLESVRGAAFEQARERGRALSLDDAIAYALGDMAPSPDPG